LIAGGFRAGAGFRTGLLDDAALRGSGIVWSPGKTPATVRGLSSLIASIASISRLGVRICSAISERGLDAADITS
jgi:hypothetical protein